DTIKCAVSKRQARQVAEDDGNRSSFAHVQHGFERGVDTGRSQATLLELQRELTEADCRVEESGARRKTSRFAKNDGESVLVARPEHLGLRPPFVSGLRHQAPA